MNTEEVHAITDEEHQRICDYMAQLKVYQAKTGEPDLSTIDAIKDWESRARDMLEWLGQATQGEYAIVEKYREPIKEAPPEVMDAFFVLQNATMELAKDIGIASEELYKMTGVQREDQEELQEKKPTTPKSEALTPSPNMTKYGIPYDKLTKNIVAEQMYLQERDGQMCLMLCVNQAKKGDKNPVLTTFMLSTADGTGITTSQRIYAEDEAIATTVANMIYTEREAGNQGPYNFTIDQIWRAEKGITDTKVTPTAKQKKETARIIDKLSNTKMKIDVRNELNRHYLKEDDHITEGYIEDTYMYSRKGHAKTKKGRVYDSYVFYDLPYLYTYNISKGHITLVDYRLLDTSDTTGNDSLTGTFKLYLLREISLMYQHKRDSHRILYDTLLKATGTPTPEERVKERERERNRPHKSQGSFDTTVRAQAKDDREKVTAILTSWKKRKWISDFCDVKDGRAFIGVDIITNPKNYAPKAITKKD